MSHSAQPASRTAAVRLALAGCLLLGLGATGASFSGATFEASSANPQTKVSSAVDWVPPLVSLADPGSVVRGTVQVSAEASDPYGSGVASVQFQRAPAGTEFWTEICKDTTSPYGCALNTATLVNDYFELRAVATDAAGYSSTSSTSEVLVDNREPTVTMNDPGATLSGVVTLSAEAADAESGVASVAIQQSIAGKSSWSDVCTASIAPYSCRFDTRTLTEGLYDLRAVATDVAGNSKASATVSSRRIDNTVSSISLEDPGAFLRGTVSLVANAASSSGIASVMIQRSPAGKSSWSEICRQTAPPYSCAWNTTTVSDGSYDLRALMVTSAGAQLYSATVASRLVDNTAVRGIDVQAINRAGGVPGRLESGDTITFTYSETMKPSSILSGWSGSSPAAIYVRLRDGALVGAGSSGDTLQFSSDSVGNAPLGIGSVNLHGDFVKSNKTSVFSATLSSSTQVVGGANASVLTITLGSLASGGALRTVSGSAQMVWTPSATATDLAGNACSVAPVYETGALDRDF